MKGFLFVLLLSLSFAGVLFNPEEEVVPLLKSEPGECYAVANGTRVSVLEGPLAGNEALGYRLKVEAFEVYKVRILEGKCKDTVGYVLKAHLKHENGKR